MFILYIISYYFVQELENIINRKYILDIIFVYVYNNGVTLQFEPQVLSYLQNLLDFLLNIDHKVSFFYSYLLYNLISIFNFIE